VAYRRTMGCMGLRMPFCVVTCKVCSAEFKPIPHKLDSCSLLTAKLRLLLEVLAIDRKLLLGALSVPFLGIPKNVDPSLVPRSTSPKDILQFHWLRVVEYEKEK